MSMPTSNNVLVLLSMLFLEHSVSMLGHLTIKIIDTLTHVYGFGALKFLHF